MTTPKGGSLLLISKTFFFIEIIHCASWSSHLAICGYKESAGLCSVYLFVGIAKHPISNKQSTPTPNRYIDTPCRGVDIRQARAF